MNTLDIINIEDKHSAYLRDARISEIQEPDKKRSYIVFEKEDEYGYRLFRGVAYTLDDACRIACETLTQVAYRKGGEVGAFVLVGTSDVDDMQSFCDDLMVQGVGSLNPYQETQIIIRAFDEYGDEVFMAQVFGHVKRQGAQQ
jgi:hypothetical protein